MHKVYLLLRNNKQSGPFTLEEVIQLGLKPIDLIWVEGKSAAWSYPSEISSLQPYLKETHNAESKAEVKPTVPFTASPEEAFMPPNGETLSSRPVPSSKLVYISLPKNKSQEPAPVKEAPSSASLEQKAEEIKKRAESYLREKQASSETKVATEKNPFPEKQPVSEKTLHNQKPADEKRETVQTKYARTLSDVEEDFTSWTYSKKIVQGKQILGKTLKPLIPFVVGVLLLATIFVVYHYNVHKVKEPASKNVAADSLHNTEIVTEKLIFDGNADKPVPAEKEEVSTPDVKPAEKQKVSTPDAKAAEKIKTSTPAPKPSSKVDVSQPLSRPDNKAANKVPIVPVIKKTGQRSEEKPKPKIQNLPEAGIKEEKHANETPVKEDRKETKAAPAPREQGPAVISVPQKKKTFNEKVDEFINQFKRKKPEEKAATEPAEDSKTTSADGGVPERKARRRADEPVAPPPVANLEEFIEISSNQTSGNWMLGVHGLKLTLNNRSSVMVKKAAVEIKYLSDQNEVLDRKVLNFSNIPAKKSFTLAVPDHRLAEHIESRLVSVEGN